MRQQDVREHRQHSAVRLQVQSAPLQAPLTPHPLQRACQAPPARYLDAHHSHLGAPRTSPERKQTLQRVISLKRCLIQILSSNFLCGTELYSMLPGRLDDPQEPRLLKSLLLSGKIGSGCNGCFMGIRKLLLCFFVQPLQHRRTSSWRRPSLPYPAATASVTPAYAAFFRLF